MAHTTLKNCPLYISEMYVQTLINTDKYNYVQLCIHDLLKTTWLSPSITLKNEYSALLQTQRQAVKCFISCLWMGWGFPKEETECTDKTWSEMPGRFVNIPACASPVPFNHDTEPALSHSWNLCPWSWQVRRSREKRRWQLCFALVQVQTEASWLEKEEGQFTLTHHCLLSTGAHFLRPPNDSPVCRPFLLPLARWSIDLSAET